MLELLTALLSEHSLWLMFISAFLSSTILPGNSEVVFLALSAKIQFQNATYFSQPIIELFTVATLGNSIGSITTYWLGRCFPQNIQTKMSKSKIKWGLEKLQRYGTLALLLSWLPIVGDLFCALAGWLRLNVVHSFLLIIIGKLIRYLFLLYLVMGYTFL